MKLRHLEHQSPVNKKDNSILHFFKIVILGEGCVGKTALLKRLANDEYSEEKQPTAIDFVNINIGADSTIIKNQIWDLSTRDQGVMKAYMKDAVAAILVFDYTNKNSLENLKPLLADFKQQAPLANVILVGNKSDSCLINNVPALCVQPDQIELFKKECGIETYIPISVKTGHNVKTILPTVEKLILARKFDPQERSRQTLIKLLDKYIRRIDSYGNEQHINFQQGFWFFAESRSLNRQANYYLAQFLHKQLSTTNEPIETIFKDIDLTRRQIMANKGILLQPSYKERGINSKQLLEVIRLADNFKSSLNPAEQTALLPHDDDHRVRPGLYEL